MEEFTIYRLLMRYLKALPGARVDRRDPQGREVLDCIYNPHSLRAPCATLLLDVGVDIREVQELLGHKHITTNPDLRQAAPHHSRERLAQRTLLRGGRPSLL